MLMLTCFQPLQAVPKLLNEAVRQSTVCTACVLLHCQFELDAAADVQSLYSQLQAHFRSQNVIYAMLVEGACHAVLCCATAVQGESQQWHNLIVLGFYSTLVVTAAAVYTLFGLQQRCCAAL